MAQILLQNVFFRDTLTTIENLYAKTFTHLVMFEDKKVAVRQSFRRGSCFTLRGTFYKRDDLGADEAYSLEGISPVLKIYQKPAFESTAYTLKATLPMTVEGSPALGHAYVEVLAEDTSALLDSSYRVDVCFIEGSGISQKVFVFSTFDLLLSD